MKLNDTLVKKLSQPFAPSTMVEMTFKGNDLSIKTDSDGRAILLFIGKRGEDGNVRGERYARRLVHDKDGVAIKDHWELKGKAT